MLACLPVSALVAQGIKAPRTVTAGDPFKIETSRQGDLLIIGTGQVLVKKASGGAVEIKEGELYTAGHYVAVLDSDSTSFDVVAAAPADLSFFAAPSRLPVAVANGISAVIYPFDKYRNLVVQPEAITLRVAQDGKDLQSRSLTTEDGVAWYRMASTSKAGKLFVTASAGPVKSERVIQEVAGDACNLRISSQRVSNGVLVKTEPVKDCHGVPVPDGTIVTFTENAGNGLTTVDAPVTAGVASTVLPAKTSAVVSAASGVALGNQIRIGGGGE